MASKGDFETLDILHDNKEGVVALCVVSGMAVDSTDKNTPGMRLSKLSHEQFQKKQEFKEVSKDHDAYINDKRLNANSKASAIPCARFSFVLSAACTL